MYESTSIKLPELNDWLDDFTQIIWHINKLKKGQSVELDMSNFSFINPGGMLLLTLICSSIYDITNVPVKFSNLYIPINLYLERMNFYNFDFVEQEKIGFLDKWKRDKATTKLIELTYLTSPYPQLIQVVEKLRDILNSWILNNDDITVSSNILSMIMEMCNNSFEHSIIKDDNLKSLGTCFILAQVYSKTDYKEVIISIGDLGIGIRKSLELKYNWIYPSDIKTLRMVLNGLSGRTISDSGGSGIPFVKDIILNNFNGEFFLRTGKAVIKCNNYDGIEENEYVNSFPGTQCIIKLQCR